LYGGNANFYHIALSDYEEILSHLAEAAGPDTVVIPSVGPQFGMMMDQAALLSELRFPSVMILPGAFPGTPEGVHEAILRFQDEAQTPVVIYIKEERNLTPELAADLVHRGGVAWIKYAVVRDDPSVDPWLSALLDKVPSEKVVSGIGEQPALIHLKQFGLGGFTSGCVCVAPTLSMNCLQAARKDAMQEAERLRELFRPLEDLRNAWGPIPVLHHAVQLAGIAKTGPLLPMLSELPSNRQEQIREAAQHLLALNREIATGTK
jgi:dihydrodipicolinate synthase/N-acetylneuraminate lyase